MGNLLSGSRGRQTQHPNRRANRMARHKFRCRIHRGQKSPFLLPTLTPTYSISHDNSTCFNNRGAGNYPLRRLHGLDEHQIADLFGCFVAKVVSNIAAVLKSGVLDESRVCRFHCYRNGGGVELYSLEMIAALAFRIDTRNADIFRRWLIERAMQPTPKYQPPITMLFPAREQTLPN